MEEDLISTGEFDRSDETSVPDRIRVQVDPETGEGKIVDNDEIVSICLIYAYTIPNKQFK